MLGTGNGLIKKKKRIRKRKTMTKKQIVRKITSREEKEINEIKQEKIKERTRE